MKKNNIGLFVLLAGFLIIISSCVKSGDLIPESYYPELYIPSFIQIVRSEFKPGKLSVKKGDSIGWANVDSVEHSVISDDRTSFNSGNITSKGYYEYHALTVGTFDYHCDKHGESGVLVVNP